MFCVFFYVSVSRETLFCAYIFVYVSQNAGNEKLNLVFRFQIKKIWM